MATSSSDKQFVRAVLAAGRLAEVDSLLRKTRSSLRPFHRAASHDLKHDRIVAEEALRLLAGRALDKQETTVSSARLTVAGQDAVMFTIVCVENPPSRRGGRRHYGTRKRDAKFAP